VKTSNAFTTLFIFNRNSNRAFIVSLLLLTYHFYFLCR